MKAWACAAALALGAAIPAAAAGDLKLRLEGEGRAFWDAAGGPTPLSVAGTAERFADWAGGTQRIAGELFQRYDAEDDARTHGDVRELYYHVIGEDLEFRAGARRVFWGVTESRHLADIVNQSDLVENISGEIKLGQPMMDLALIRDSGTYQVLLMPYQRARTFPGQDGHPRLPLPVHAFAARYESPRGQSHLDAALRYASSFGPFDLGLAYFNGTAREPRLVPCLRQGARFAGNRFQGTRHGPNCDIPSGIPEPGVPAQLVPVLQALGFAPTDEQAAKAVFSSLVLVPHYDRLEQFSIDAQAVTGALALKLEALRREQGGGDSLAAVTGFEYTFGDVWATGADVGVLGEYLFDEREEFLGVLADEEVFAGGRLSLNDVAGTQVLGGVILDRRRFDNRLYGLEASRRLGDDWKLTGELRIFSRMPDGVAGFLGDQDFVAVTLERYF
jgi:hypothetical protein